MVWKKEKPHPLTGNIANQKIGTTFKEQIKEKYLQLALGSKFIDI